MKGRRRYRQIVFDALPGSVVDVSIRTGISRSSVFRWLRDLHAAGEVHVGDWRRGVNGGVVARVYHAGPGTDVRCRIKRYTEAEKSKRYRKRALQTGVWARRLARQRAKYWAERALVRRDPLAAALFGGS